MKTFRLALLAASVSVISGTALAHEAGDLLIKFGPALVDPNSSSSTQEGGILPPGLDVVTVDTGESFTISATYMVSDNLGLELLGALPFNHDIQGYGALEGVQKVGSTDHLPPTLLANFYLPVSEKFIPFAGIGYNYTLFFNEDTSEAFSGALGADTDLSLSDSHGVAYEIGFDIPLDESVMVTASAWNIDIDTTATVYANGLEAQKIDVEIDPWVYMVGIGLKF